MPYIVQSWSSAKCLPVRQKNCKIGREGHPLSMLPILSILSMLSKFSNMHYPLSIIHYPTWLWCCCRACQSGHYPLFIHYPFSIIHHYPSSVSNFHTLVWCCCTDCQSGHYPCTEKMIVNVKVEALSKD